MINLEYVISICLLLLIVILFLPFNKVFPTQNLNKLLAEILPKSEFNRNKQKKASPLYKWFLNTSESAFKISRLKVSQRSCNLIKNRLILADLNDKVSIEAFLGGRIISAVILFFYALLIYTANPRLMTFIVLLASPLLGYNLPNVILTRIIKKRQWTMQKELPYILNTLAIITDAGLSFSEAITKLCESKKGCLIDEFTRMDDEMKMGVMQKEALMRLSERCQINEITVFVFALVQSLEKGASGICEILKDQSREVWEKRKNKARELGEMASIKLFFPMLILVFPCLLIFLIGPAAVSIIKIFVN